MEKKSIVNFSSFYEGNTEKRKPFDKGEIGKPLFKDIKTPNPESVSESKKSEKKNQTEKKEQNGGNKTQEKQTFVYELFRFLVKRAL